MTVTSILDAKNQGAPTPLLEHVPRITVTRSKWRFEAVGLPNSNKTNETAKRLMAKAGFACPTPSVLQSVNHQAEECPVAWAA